MTDVTIRQAKILAAIVKEYSQTGHPVGSEELPDKYNFEISPATIRNEMKALEEMDLISQPHTSAGRVPTDQGYRYFVNKLMKHVEMTAAERQRLEQELRKFKQQYLELGQSLTRLLAEEAQGAAFAFLPHSTSTSGLSNIIEETTGQKEVKELAKFLDELDACGKVLDKTQGQDVETFIGRETPAPARLSDFSLVVSRVRLPSGQRGIIGILGPKRMKYARNISLLEYISKLLSSGLGILIIIHYL